MQITPHSHLCYLFILPFFSLSFSPSRKQQRLLIFYLYTESRRDQLLERFLESYSSRPALKDREGTKKDTLLAFDRCRR